MQSDDDKKSCRSVRIPVMFTVLGWAVAAVALWRRVSRTNIVEFQRDGEDQAGREAVGRSEALRRHCSARPCPECF
ncbi:hypothetical protein M758_8G182000 [Ceratodon purpureus]|nr:hypothetical protein M758_8G182000 [Ceratodon purpureus]